MKASVIGEMKELEDSPTEKLAKTCNGCHLVAEYWKDRGQECPLLDREGIITPLMLEEGQVKLDFLHTHLDLLWVNKRRTHFDVL